MGGVVSFLIAKYVIRHGPNYEDKIQSVYEVLASLAKTQEALREQHERFAITEKSQREVEEKKAAAIRWKPAARVTSEIEGSEQVNKLILQSKQEFCVNEVALISSTGTKLHEYPVMGPKVFSTGFSIPISHASLILIANSSESFFQRSTFEGRLRYSVERQDSALFEGELPFHAETVYVHNTLWFKLAG